MSDTSSLRSLRIQRLVLQSLPYIIVLLTIGIIFLTTRLAATTKEVQQTSAYTRVTNCIVAKGASTQPEKELCYIKVEKSTGQSLERFDEEKGDN